ncbi:MAG: hypothetical protein HRU36_01615, partial [Rickettsiales bacterium]|nr:hypothetical protein [Rickettsiales bacterium]
MPRDYSQFLANNPYYDIHPQNTQELPDASYLQAFYREMGGEGKPVNPFYIVGGEINLDEQVRLMKEFAETKNDAKLASRFALEEATKDSLKSHQEETNGDLSEALQMEQALAHSKIIAAEEEQKAQESLQKKVELAKAGGYIAKNYKEIFKFMNNASSFFGFGEIVDENNAIIKHTAHGFHALTSLWGSYLSKD